MRLILAIAAVAATLTAAASPAEAQQRKRDLVVKVKPRSYLDAGTQAAPGTYQIYSLGQTPFRSFDSIVQTGSPESRVLPGRFGVMWQ